MKNPIKLIAFDLFGVVISEGHMVSNVLMPLLPVGTSKTLVKSHYQAYTLGMITEEEFWKSIGQTQNTALRLNFLDSFALDSAYEAVIHSLKPSYELAILSNLAKDWGEYLTTKFAFSDHFSPIIISGEVKCGKPDPTIYSHLIEQSGLEGAEIAFIDDRLENLVVAHDFDMTTLHYHRERDQHNYQADYVIKDLSDLVSLLSPRASNSLIKLADPLI